MSQTTAITPAPWWTPGLIQSAWKAVASWMPAGSSSREGLDDQPLHQFASLLRHECSPNQARQALCYYAYGIVGTGRVLLEIEDPSSPLHPWRAAVWPEDMEVSESRGEPRPAPFSFPLCLAGVTRGYLRYFPPPGWKCTSSVLARLTTLSVLAATVEFLDELDEDTHRLEGLRHQLLSFASFHRKLATTLAFARRRRQPVSLACFELAGLSSTTALEQVVQTAFMRCARSVLGAARPGDFAGRLDESRIAVVYPETPFQRALPIARMQARAIDEVGLTTGLERPLKAIVGLASYPESGPEADSLLESAKHSSDRSRQILKGSLELAAPIQGS